MPTGFLPWLATTPGECLAVALQFAYTSRLIVIPWGENNILLAQRKCDGAFAPPSRTGRQSENSTQTREGREPRL